MQPSLMVLSLPVPLHLQMSLNQCQWESVCTRMGSVYGQVRQHPADDSLTEILHTLVHVHAHHDKVILSLSSYTECTAWLSPCQTSWNCDSEFQYRVSQAYPPPACPYPGHFFVPPPMPGMCEYNLESGQCQFHGERKSCNHLLRDLPYHITVSFAH